MTIFRTVTVAVIASILITTLPAVARANGDDVSPSAVNLRASIDRAAAKSVAESADSALTPRGPQAAAKSMQGMGGGGGAGMIVWTVIGTVTGLATTYFIVKEMRKQTEKASEQ